MATIHFLNVLEGDCNIIQHDSGRVTVIDVSNAYNDEDTEEEKAVKASEQRKRMLERTQVPYNKTDYKQKHDPDNPIEYLGKYSIDNIFRFIITHPDMDHLDGIRDMFEEFTIYNVWDTDNDKECDVNAYFGGYNKEDWEFYKNLREGKYTQSRRLTNYDGISKDFWNEDQLHILCPSPALVERANATKDYNDASYVILFTPPKRDGTNWKILFTGDSHDDSWNYILNNYAEEVSNVDILMAPHHGRDSDRSYEFLKTLKPKVTLFGNASSRHLAYSCYPPTRITNNQAGYIIIDSSLDELGIYVKNQDFMRDFRSKKDWPESPYNHKFDGYLLGALSN